MQDGSDNALVTLDNFDENAKKAGISSPRSLEALKACGIDSAQLLRKPIEYFVKKWGVENATVFYERFEHRRQTYLTEARQFRHALIQKQNARLASSSSRTALLSHRPYSQRSTHRSDSDSPSARPRMSSATVRDYDGSSDDQTGEESGSSDGQPSSVRDKINGKPNTQSSINDDTKDVKSNASPKLAFSSSSGHFDQTTSDDGENSESNGESSLSPTSTVDYNNSRRKRSNRHPWNDDKLSGNESPNGMNGAGSGSRSRSHSPQHSRSGYPLVQVDIAAELEHRTASAVDMEKKRINTLRRRRERELRLKVSNELKREMQLLQLQHAEEEKAKREAAEQEHRKKEERQKMEAHMNALKLERERQAAKEKELQAAAAREAAMAAEKAEALERARERRRLSIAAKEEEHARRARQRMEQARQAQLEKERQRLAKEEEMRIADEERQRAIEAKKREAELRAKEQAAERDRLIAEMAAQREAEMMAKIRALEEKDRQREWQHEQLQRQRAEEVRRAQEELAERHAAVARAREQAEREMQLRHARTLEREAAAEARRQMAREEQQRQVRMAKLNEDEKSQRRNEVLDNYEKTQNERLRHLLKRQEEAEARAAQAQQRLREHQHALKMTKAAIEEDRRLHQERVARMQEYRRQQLEERQRKDRQRIEDMEKRRAELRQRLLKTRSRLERVADMTDPESGWDEGEDNDGSNDESESTKIDEAVIARVSARLGVSKAYAARVARSMLKRSHVPSAPTHRSTTGKHHQQRYTEEERRDRSGLMASSSSTLLSERRGQEGDGDPGNSNDSTTPSSLTTTSSQIHSNALKHDDKNNSNTSDGDGDGDGDNQYAQEFEGKDDRVNTQTTHDPSRGGNPGPTQVADSIYGQPSSTPPPPLNLHLDLPRHGTVGQQGSNIIASSKFNRPMTSNVVSRRAREVQSQSTGSHIQGQGHNRTRPMSSGGLMTTQSSTAIGNAYTMPKQGQRRGGGGGGHAPSPTRIRPHTASLTRPITGRSSGLQHHSPSDKTGYSRPPSYNRPTNPLRPSSSSGSGVGGEMNIRPLTSRMPSEADWAEAEALEQMQNDYMMRLLKAEEQAELDRRKLLASAPSAAAAQRLQAIFQTERARASAMLQSVFRHHQITLAHKLEAIGVTPIVHGGRQPSQDLLSSTPSSAPT